MDATDMALDGSALVAASPRLRAVAALRRPANWWQLVRFGVVGASGYVVNLATYALFVHAGGVDYRIAACLAFLVAVANNFLLNRRWTFGDARHGHAGFQAVRFFVVSIVVFAVQLGLLTGLVEVAHLSRIAGQAIAIAWCTPLSFLGNKLWSFRARPRLA